MVRKFFHILLFLLVFQAVAVNAQSVQKQPPSVPANFRVSEEEMKLYKMINDYRFKYNLPPIPLSLSLSYVASMHVRDLFFHHPDQDPCNFHSWSDKGPWKAFCYPRDENKKNSVWDQPKELTPYKGKGYEIVYWENSAADIDSVINFWKSVDYFNGFLMNTGKWLGNKWEAIGIGVYENYACAWFGQLPDPTGPPLMEGQSPAVKDVADTGKDKISLPPVIPPKVVVAKPADTAAKPSALNSEGKPFKYYIIVRSNIPLKDTVTLMKVYRDKGYSLLRFFPNDGKGRISVFETFDRAEATATLKEIKKQFAGAWLFKN